TRQIQLAVSWPRGSVSAGSYDRAGHEPRLPLRANRPQRLRVWRHFDTVSSSVGVLEVPWNVNLPKLGFSVVEGRPCRGCGASAREHRLTINVRRLCELPSISRMRLPINWATRRKSSAG